MVTAVVKEIEVKDVIKLKQSFQSFISYSGSSGPFEALTQAHVKPAVTSKLFYTTYTTVHSGDHANKI